MPNVYLGLAVRKLSRYKIFVYASLLLWLFASASGMHGHYCFDGVEPPMSVHFDVVDSHENDQHESGEAHVDLDNKPSQATAVKIVKLDLTFLAFALLLTIIWPVVRSQSYTLSQTPFSWLTLTGIRPPLRAPPIQFH